MASIDVTTSAAQILPANSDRTGFIIVNDSSVVVYLGPSSSVTASGSTTNDGIPLYANSSLTESQFGGWKGDIYGITASGTASIRYWERRR